MRAFIAVLVLIFSFQSWTKADDIRDLEIEGMSIGDSLLDYFSEKEILNGLRADSYENSDRKFIDTNLIGSWFNTYEGIQVTIKRNDNKYIVHSIDGGIFFDRDDKACVEKMNSIINDISKIYKETKINKEPLNKHPQDLTGRSTTQGSSIFLKNGNIVVLCYLWDESMGHQNYVAVSTRTKEFNDWLIAYQN